MLPAMKGEADAGSQAASDDQVYLIQTSCSGQVYMHNWGEIVKEWLCYNEDIDDDNRRNFQVDDIESCAGRESGDAYS
jgi:hypothetical protein